MSEIILNEDQENAMKSLQDFIKEDSRHMCLLSGFAGVGKTFLVSQFIEWVAANSMFHNIAMAAPTNKALRVLKEMCPDSTKGSVTFATLHSLLGLKHEITKDGKEIFVKDKKTMSKFAMFDLVIVDEASMIADQLFNEMEEQNFRNVKVLFVGDPHQINPVNHSMAIPMLEVRRMEYNIRHITLDKIVRQAEGNPIIEISQRIIRDSYEHTPGFKQIKDDCGVVMLADTQTKILTQLIKYYFDSSAFDDNANYCKIIAWRNVTVDYYNKLVRGFKYGPKSNKIVEGEKLIVSRPIKTDDGSSTAFSTNEDLIVGQIDVKEKSLYGGTTWKYYDCLVQGYENTGNIHILHEADEVKYNQYIKTLANDAISEKDVSKRIDKWKKYFSFMENFAQVGYGYANTIHNSQGSTYENAFVIYSDIMYNRNEEERKRILYTAMTRPKKMLYIV